MPSETTQQDKVFVISRTFDAPRALVWKSWTEPDRMKRWWGPKGSTILDLKMDLRPGGTTHYRFHYAGQDMWGKAVYLEIVPQERLMWVNSFSDAAGGVTRHPLAPTWPIQMHTTLTVTEQGGKTTLTIRWVPIDPTPEERTTFAAGFDSMRQGWTGTFDQLTEYLATAK